MHFQQPDHAGQVLTQPAFAEAPNSVIVGGKNIGPDPDSNGRFQMRRDVGTVVGAAAAMFASAAIARDACVSLPLAFTQCCSGNDFTRMPSEVVHVYWSRRHSKIKHFVEAFVEELGLVIHGGTVLPRSHYV